MSDMFAQQFTAACGWFLRACDVELEKVTDLNSRQVILLMNLRDDHTMTLTQVSRSIGGAGDDVRSLLSPLFNKGFIQRSKPFSEERIEITARGEQAVSDLRAVLEATVEKIFIGLSEAERSRLTDYLRRLYANSRQMSGG